MINCTVWTPSFRNEIMSLVPIQRIYKHISTFEHFLNGYVIFWFEFIIAAIPLYIHQSFIEFSGAWWNLKSYSYLAVIYTLLLNTQNIVHLFAHSMKPNLKDMAYMQMLLSGWHLIQYVRLIVSFLFWHRTVFPNSEYIIETFKIQWVNRLIDSSNHMRIKTTRRTKQ